MLSAPFSTKDLHLLFSGEGQVLLAILDRASEGFRHSGKNVRSTSQEAAFTGEKPPKFRAESAISDTKSLFFSGTLSCCPLFSYTSPDRSAFLTSFCFVGLPERLLVRRKASASVVRGRASIIN
jgi:hypothetical protein